MKNRKKNAPMDKHAECIKLIRNYVMKPADSSHDLAYREYLSNCAELSRLDKKLADEDITPQEVEIIFNQIKQICKVS